MQGSRPPLLILLNRAHLGSPISRRSYAGLLLPDRHHVTHLQSHHLRCNPPPLLLPTNAHTAAACPSGLGKRRSSADLGPVRRRSIITSQRRMISTEL